MHRTNRRVPRASIVAFAVAAFVMLAGLIPQVGYAQPPPEEEESLSEVDLDDVEFEDDRAEPEAEVGLGVRLRQVYIPTSLIDIFVDQSPGGVSHTGIGVELIRQKGSFVISLGVEYESISLRDGIYIEKGETIPSDIVDFVKFDDLAWIGADVSFIYQQSVIDQILWLRYGAGLGAGYVLGGLLRTDYRCETSAVSSCGRDPEAQNDNAPVGGVPPVLPIVNVFVGAQVRPTGSLAINIEGGIRTVPFVGTTVALLF